MLIKQHRDRLGRFAKFDPTKELKPIIVNTKTRSIISEGIYSIRKRLSNFTGIKYTQRGRFVRLPTKGEHRIQLDRAYIFIDGVRVAELRANETISKRTHNWIIANLKGGKTPSGSIKFPKVKTREDLLRLLSTLYPDSPSVASSIESITEAGTITADDTDGSTSKEFSGMLPAYLPPNSALYKRKPFDNYIDEFWVLDTEDNSEGDMKIANLFNGSHHYSFVSNNTMQLKFEVWKFINEKFSRDGAIIFCVNLQYDLNNTYGEVWKEWEPIFSGSILLSAGLKPDKDDKKHRSKIKFYESMGQVQLGVKKLGEAIGLYKLDVGERRINLEYCKRDCEITWKALRKIFDFDKKNQIEFGMSIASKALKYFRTHVLEKSIKQRIFSEFIPGYRGGRVEIVKWGKQKDINVYDINSLYPYVMANFSYPCPKDAIITNQIETFGVYYVRLKIKDSTYIPYLGKLIKGKYIFPVGEFFGLYTGFELIQAFDLGQIEEIEMIQGWKFSNMGAVFKPYVDKFYTLRAENADDKLLNKYLKILMNSLYGKFGQGNKSLIYDPKDDVFIEDLSGYPRHSNIIWAMFTTAYARHVLYQYLDKFKKSVVYCDTDCVHLIKDTIECGLGLGEMKLEGSFKNGNYLQPKVYSLENEIEKKFVAKGISGGQKETYIKTGTATFKRPVKTREFLRNRFNRSNNKLLRELKLNKWIEITKKMKSEYHKREIINKNGDTIPIKLYLMNRNRPKS